MRVARRGATAARWTLFALLAATLAVATPRLAAQGIPDRLTDAEFWRMVTDFSEPNGYFQSENLLSNETGFQAVIPELLRTVKPGGVYLGVGPEQNFTYIVALHPKIAFIVDIRHQNAVHHLLYKALIELSDNRADFVSRLFSRLRPAGLDVNTSMDTLFAAFANVKPDSLMFYKTLTAIKDRLMKDHKFAMTPEELQLLEHNLDAFYQAGPQLSYNFNAGNFGNRPGGGMPTYSSLMQATDNTGVRRSYLATDANYQVLRDIEMRNLLVPLTGDFSGPKALRTVGDYARQHGATITTFYTSNVEQYLFRNGYWFTFEASVATLPLDSTSTFIRSGRPGPGGGYGGGFGGGRGGMATPLLQSMTELVKATDEKRIQTYRDVLATSH